MLDRIYGWSQLVTICSSPQVFAGLCAFFRTPFFLLFLGFSVVSYEVRNLVERPANREQVG